MVSWHITFSDKTTLEGQVDDGSWGHVQDLINHKALSIKTLNLSSENGIARIDNNCDGYFVGNKILTALPSNTSTTFVGIGYWKKHESVARIKWYNVNTMSLAFTEARPTGECGFFLVKNYV